MNYVIIDDFNPKYMNFLKFIKEVALQCSNYNVDFKMIDAPIINYTPTITCSGFFVEHPTPKLHVATGKPFDIWAPILVHEFAHMQQWLDQDPKWIENKISSFEYADILDLWLMDIVSLSTKQQQSVFSKIMDVEFDAERRSVELIKKFDLDINIPEYCQKANAYVFFYFMVKKYKKWYKPGFEPYNIKEVWSQFPENLDNEPVILSSKLERLYRKYTMRD